MSLPLQMPQLAQLDRASERIDAAQREASTGDLGAARAAEQFEGILIQQLWKTMRQTVQGGLLGDAPGSDTYLSMVDEAVAGQVARDGGIGLRDTLMRAFGVDTASPVQASTELTALRPRGPRPAPEPATGDGLEGAAGRLQEVAREMLAPGSAEHWSREGRLTPEDMRSDFTAQVPGGVARFNVQDAAGYRGYYKCNLFALEMARRAGFSVPLTPRSHGFSYPSPDSLAADAADGSLRGRWGRVATGESAESLEAAVSSGRRAFMLTASGSDGHAGHMGVVERIHQVDYSEGGEVRRVVFDGWEARRDGARHLTRRTWNVRGNPGGENVRGGLGRIEIIELAAPRQGEAPEVPLSLRAGPSSRDE
ncbi:MAG: hypothetical protein GXP55_15450 [Deltaproteobacteria bacterium]|nr:hypothetical protein [Deltaproteobacteria bacterium]